MLQQSIKQEIHDDIQGIWTTVLGIKETCWKCKKPTTLAAGLRFDCHVGITQADDSNGFLIFDDDTSDIIASVLNPVVRQQCGVGVIRMRYSRTADANYLANGCVHCDAIQGNFPLRELIDAAHANHGSEAKAHRAMTTLVRLRLPQWVMHELERRVGDAHG